jgi:hypothetical protein
MLSLTRLIDGDYVLILENEYVHGSRAGIEQKMKLIGISVEQIRALFSVVSLVEQEENGQRIDVCLLDGHQLLSQSRRFV